MRYWLYVDMDAFYVSCELRERPDLVGHPVIVGPDPRLGFARGVVLSASYEARKFGVRSAIPAARALRMCPEAVWIRADFAKYERAAREIRDLLAARGDRVVPLSIDEAAVAVDVPGPEEGRRAALSIQSALRDQLKLPASLGVATDRTVAKIASDRAKPAGVVVVAPSETAQFLAALPVEVVPGIGPKTAERLHAIGATTIGSLLELPAARLRSAVGEMATELRALARGTPTDRTSDEDGRGPRSRSTAQTFGEDIGDLEELHQVADGLSASLAGSLASEKLRFQTVTVGLRWEDFERTQRSHTLSAAHEDAATLRGAARRVLAEAWAEERHGAGRKVRTLTVGVERLTDRRMRQLPLEEFDRSTNDIAAGPVRAPPPP
jgi:nucleotidyltransferase/DNA polymerase involved in DNA repair